MYVNITFEHALIGWYNDESINKYPKEKMTPQFEGKNTEQMVKVL